MSTIQIISLIAIGVGSVVGFFLFIFVVLLSVLWIREERKEAAQKRAKSA